MRPCTYCGERATHNTTVSGLYLCEADFCLGQAASEHLLDGELTEEDHEEAYHEYRVTIDLKRINEADHEQDINKGHRTL